MKWSDMRKKVIIVKTILFMLFVLAVPVLSCAQEGTYNEEEIDSPDETFLNRVKALNAKKLSDLVYLSPFSDVAVIQRRFMPKTGRVSASLSSAFILSSEYFLNPGVEGHLSYHFLEKHGIELSGYYVLTFNRGVTNNLATIGANVSETLPIANTFFGLTYKWMPVYGKIAFYNKSILAFDTFFNLGLGMSGINKKRSKNERVVVWEPTVIAGIGQVFAITRDLGLRWDLRWNMTIETQSANVTVLNNILFSLGFSYYYPSAGLR